MQGKVRSEWKKKSNIMKEECIKLICTTTYTTLEYAVKWNITIFGWINNDICYSQHNQERREDCKESLCIQRNQLNQHIYMKYIEISFNIKRQHNGREKGKREYVTIIIIEMNI